jgi:hypothetical protein
MPVLLRLILPVAVTLKRFFAELCVLTFGILVLKFGCSKACYDAVFSAFCSERFCCASCSLR